MESTSSPDNGRQSRGLARFWPVHGMPAPVQRESQEDADEAGTPQHAAKTTPDGPVAGEPPRSGDIPPALTGDTEMVALGSRRTPEIINGGRPWNSNQGGFPPVESERGSRNGDVAPRHGGGPVPRAIPAAHLPYAPTTPTSADGPAPAPFAPGPQSPASPFATGPQSPASPFGPGSPFVPASPFAPGGTGRGSGNAPSHTAGTAQPTSGGPGSRAGEQDSRNPLAAATAQPTSGGPGSRAGEQDRRNPLGAAPVPAPGASGEQANTGGRPGENRPGAGESAEDRLGGGRSAEDGLGRERSAADRLSDAGRPGDMNGRPVVNGRAEASDGQELSGREDVAGSEDATGRRNVSGHGDAGGPLAAGRGVVAGHRPDADSRPDTGGSLEAGGRREAGGRLEGGGRPEAGGRLGSGDPGNAGGRGDGSRRRELSGSGHPDRVRDDVEAGSAEPRDRARLGNRTDSTGAPDGVGRAAATGRADVPGPRAAAGWASVPTSGIPIIETAGNGPIAGSAPAAGGTTPVSGTPVTGTPVTGTPATGTPVIGGSPEGMSGNRRDWAGPEEDRPSVVRRSTSLDDFEDARPRAGRRAALDADVQETAPDPGRTGAERGRPESGNPESGRAQTNPTDTSRAETGRLGRETSHPGTSHPEITRAENSSAENSPAAGSRAASGGADISGAERGRADTGRADMGRADTDRAETGSAESGMAEGGRAEGGRAEGGRAETGRHDGAARSGPDGRADAPMRPGDVGETAITFWDEEAVTHFRAQWHEVKADFVDDPVTALTRAHELLTEAVNELTESLLAERDELDPLRTTATPDTESMRMAMRGYREFLDRILAL